MGPMKNQIMDALHQNSEVQFLKRENAQVRQNTSSRFVILGLRLCVIFMFHFLRSLYARQEATFRTRHGTTDLFKIGKGSRQGYILSPCLVNLYAECVLLLSNVWLFATPWTVAHQAPLSMGFSRQEYWSGLPFLSQTHKYPR